MRGQSRSKLMYGMKRKFSYFALVLSLLLWLTTVVYWIRNRSFYESLSRVSLHEDSQGMIIRQWTLWAGSDGVSVYKLGLRVSNEVAEQLRQDIMPTVNHSWVIERGGGAQGGMFDMQKLCTGSFHEAFGVQYGYGSGFGPDGIDGRYAIKFRYWLLFATFGALPAIATFRVLSRYKRISHWRKGSCCLTCGYDLTGNTSGVCPECGTAVVKMGRSA